MKSFIVKIEIQAGEYQKHSTKIVQAACQKEASDKALLGECHGDIGRNTEWTDRGIADMHWEFHYSVRSVKEVPPEHLSVISQYL